MTHSVTRNVDVVVQLSPEECAASFALSDTHFQAAFLNELGRLAEIHDGTHGLKHAWWEWQCSAIAGDEGVPEISDDAKQALTKLWDYVCNNPSDGGQS